jgi:probable phosphoglycerate mutase
VTALTDLWVLRHGETAWSAARRHTGRTDVPLSPEGEQQAHAVRGRLAGVHFDAVVVSPLQRARRTAELAGYGDVRVEPLAVEWDYGAYEGLTREQVQEQVPDWSPWTHTDMPGGETLEDVVRRARTVLDHLREQVHGRALVVAHAHFLRVLATQWIEQEARLAGHLMLGPARLGVLGDDRGTAVIGRWNT